MNDLADFFLTNVRGIAYFIASVAITPPMKTQKMKQLKTILREAQENHQADEFEFYADAERTGEISRKTYFRACAAGDATHGDAAEWLRENYQRAGIAHLY